MSSAHSGTLILVTAAPGDISPLRGSCATHGYSIEHVDIAGIERRVAAEAGVIAVVLYADVEVTMVDTIRDLAPDIPVFVIVKRGAVQEAVAALRRGATDIVEESADVEQLTRALDAIAVRPRTPPAGLGGWRSVTEEEEPLIGATPTMRKLFDLVGRVASTEANVLITGEYGTGKEGVARRIHSASRRSAAPFLTLNACGLSPMMVERLLFGHTCADSGEPGGPGLLEQASGGTLFLDELAHIPPTVHLRLARALDRLATTRIGAFEEIAIDVRFIGATTADICEATRSVACNLLFRVNSVEVAVPPLRERREDIRPIAMRFLQRYAREYRKTVVGFDKAAVDALIDYPWPGNLRELEHTINRAVLACQGESITIEDLALRSASDRYTTLDDMTIAEAEAALVQRAMRRFNGNVSEAARALGISRGALYRRLERYRTTL